MFEPGAEPRPTAIYWALRVLRTIPAGAVVSTRTASPNFSRYQGGYDIRAAALSGDGSLALWAVNRASRATPATLRVPGWQGRRVTLRHYYVAGAEGVPVARVGRNYRRQLDPQPATAQFTPAGELSVSLPPASVSTLVITVAR